MDSYFFYKKKTEIHLLKSQILEKANL